ncbi:heme ABC exporter ATP-binding protein CcmA [Moraxella marmotae]|uniref:heme ABC exporter ATP-binding protein CcmA n=1 Tax=Moraxella marmotae TaxID=3344520 RepID=UPI0035F4FC4E
MNSLAHADHRSDRHDCTATTTAETTATTCRPILTIDGVDVQRGEFLLCQGVNLTLSSGDVCHLIGENGLGKTTLMSQIAGLLPISTGQVRCVGGMGYVSHQLGISTALSVEQNLRFLLSLYGVRADGDVIDDALTQVGLQGLGGVSSVQLSAGQMRRVGLARLFVLTPAQTPLWLLDEPLTALDTAMVATLERRISDFAAAGGAVLMTSHQNTRVANMTLDLAEYAL